MEIVSHYGALEYVRTHLVRNGYEVAVIRQDDDGGGSLSTVRSRDRDMHSVIRYHLPCATEILDDQIRMIGETEDSGAAWDRSRRD